MKLREASYLAAVAELLIDPEDEYLLAYPLWFDPAGYACCLYQRQKTRLHRVIANPPPGFVVDHINRNKLDNRRMNLRVCTQSENMRNQKRRIDNSSGVVGVWWDTNRRLWSCQITINGKVINLGRFNSRIEASQARQNAELKYWGEVRRRDVSEQETY